MGKKIGWVVVSCLMVLSLVIASCGPKEEPVKEEPVKEEPVKEEPVKEEPVQKEEVVVPGKEVPWWERMFGKPEYGGTITLTVGELTVFDPWNGDNQLMVWEPLTHWDNLASQEEAENFIVGPPGMKQLPWIAESWEETEPLTWTVHLRKGVKWQNKPPVNGREFTAYDIEYHFHRLAGWPGKYGFTQKSPYTLVSFTNIESINATDKYTLVYKFKQFSLGNGGTALGSNCFVAPKEAVDLWGNVNDWRHCIGTGPFMIKDYVTASSITYERSPSYWGYDERYPENQLPYADRLLYLIMPDASTQLAALRTGKLDFKGYFLGGNLNWETAASLKKTNPELVQIPQFGSGGGISLRISSKPFDDIRVRKAMQMSFDLKTLAATYYGGIPDGTPVGPISTLYTNQVVPYEEWPQEVKDGFQYNPAGAKKLLAEAGYPNGFKTSIILSGSSDLLLIVKAWLFDIGIDMEIKTVDGPTWSSMHRTKTWDQMSSFGISGSTMPWTINLGLSRTVEPWWNNSANDPVFDKIFDAASLAQTQEEQYRLIKELFMHEVSHFYHLYLQPSATINVHQPWLKGYYREYIHVYQHMTVLPRWWIDQDLKTAMGY